MSAHVSSAAQDFVAQIPASHTTTCHMLEAGDGGTFDLSLHIASVFIILAVSFLGTTLPLAWNFWFKTGVHGALPVLLVKLFGAGVVLAASLVHKFMPSHRLLATPCLPSVLSDHFDEVSGAIVLSGMLTTMLLHLLAANTMRRTKPPVALAALETPRTSIELSVVRRWSMDLGEAMLSGAFQLKITNAASEAVSEGPDNLVSDISVLAPPPAMVRGASTDSAVSAASATSRTWRTGASTPLTLVESGAHSHTPGALIVHGHRRWRMYVIELCIAAHSLIFGLSLGASRDKFRVLLVALSFHQFIEGEALSNLVIQSNFRHLSVANITVATYSLVTPIGIAIGIALNSWFSAGSWQAVLVEGVLSAFSAGMLLFDVLANILAPHFQSSSFLDLAPWKQAFQIAAVALGVYSMATIGLWL
ncbi:hypothetical protein HK105_202805 [Polyrhizophydium stewartii]|uniref:Uncharacterized protein n=1 Tax=Polyrhizophydium stewartii TaxID=2732419 RepID=A0ABR4NDK3_9FUNG